MKRHRQPSIADALRPHRRLQRYIEVLDPDGCNDIHNVDQTLIDSKVEFVPHRQAIKRLLHQLWLGHAEPEQSVVSPSSMSMAHEHVVTHANARDLPALVAHGDRTWHPRRVRREALLIGVAAFRKFVPLQNAARGPHILEAVFQSLGYDHTEVLCSPTRQAILRAVQVARQRLSPADVLCVYICTHVCYSGGEQRLVPADGLPDDPGTLLAVPELQSAICPEPGCRGVLVCDAHWPDATRLRVPCVEGFTLLTPHLLDYAAAPAAGYFPASLSQAVLALLSQGRNPITLVDIVAEVCRRSPLCCMRVFEDRKASLLVPLVHVRRPAGDLQWKFGSAFFVPTVHRSVGLEEVLSFARGIPDPTSKAVSVKESKAPMVVWHARLAAHWDPEYRESMVANFSEKLQNFCAVSGVRGPAAVERVEEGGIPGSIVLTVRSTADVFHCASDYYGKGRLFCMHKMLHEPVKSGDLYFLSAVGDIQGFLDWEECFQSQGPLEEAHQSAMRGPVRGIWMHLMSQPLHHDGPEQCHDSARGYGFGYGTGGPGPQRPVRPVTRPMRPYEHGPERGSARDGGSVLQRTAAHSPGRVLDVPPRSRPLGHQQQRLRVEGIAQRRQKNVFHPIIPVRAYPYGARHDAPDRPGGYSRDASRSPRRGGTKRQSWIAEGQPRRARPAPPHAAGRARRGGFWEEAMRTRRGPSAYSLHADADVINIESSENDERREPSCDSHGSNSALHEGSDWDARDYDNDADVEQPQGFEGPQDDLNDSDGGDGGGARPLKRFRESSQDLSPRGAEMQRGLQRLSVTSPDLMDTEDGVVAAEGGDPAVPTGDRPSGAAAVQAPEAPLGGGRGGGGGGAEGGPERMDEDGIEDQIRALEAQVNSANDEYESSRSPAARRRQAQDHEQEREIERERLRLQREKEQAAAVREAQRRREQERSEEKRRRKREKKRGQLAEMLRAEAPGVDVEELVGAAEKSMEAGTTMRAAVSAALQAIQVQAALQKKQLQAREAMRREGGQVLAAAEGPAPAPAPGGGGACDTPGRAVPPEQPPRAIDSLSDSNGNGDVCVPLGVEDVRERLTRLSALGPAEDLDGAIDALVEDIRVSRAPEEGVVQALVEHFQQQDYPEAEAGRLAGWRLIANLLVVLPLSYSKALRGHICKLVRDHLPRDDGGLQILRGWAPAADGPGVWPVEVWSRMESLYVGLRVQGMLKEDPAPKDLVHKMKQEADRVAGRVACERQILQAVQDALEEAPHGRRLLLWQVVDILVPHGPVYAQGFGDRIDQLLLSYPAGGGPFRALVQQWVDDNVFSHATAVLRRFLTGATGER